VDGLTLGERAREKPAEPKLRFSLDVAPGRQPWGTAAAMLVLGMLGPRHWAAKRNPSNQAAHGIEQGYRMRHPRNRDADVTKIGP
jgi:hypothetical protein